ncbi:MAG: DNA internalization-related competence protein ComEC/Rec2 [Tissierellaceae bacterium]|nr:DNA internalization-related competence protein ComEC/Rec2 [Tissierellaceae bacterium]
MIKPFTILTIPLIIGILISYYFTINIYMVFILLVFTILSLIYNIIKGALNQRVLLILFLLFGIFIGINAESSNLHRYMDKRLDFVGIVEEVLDREEDFSKYILSIDNVDNKSTPKERIILNVIGSKALEIGEKVYFSGELKLPKENTNPKLFNYRLNLMTEKIYTTMTIKEHDIHKINRDNISTRYIVKTKFTDLVKDTFYTYLSEDNASLMTSIFLGQSSYLKDEDIDTYRDMGLAHILAVSGLHIGIISGFITFVLSNLGIKRRVNVIITLSTIWIYGYLIGFPPSILRSSIMFSVLYLSQLIHEPYDSINTLSFAMFVLLLINPYYLFNIGFQLSFGATFSIIIFAPRIKHRFYPYINKLTTSLASILGVQIGLFPFQAYYFNQINLLSIIANLVIIPIISFGLVLGFLMIVFGFLPFVSILIGFALNKILNFEVFLLDILKEVDIFNIKVFSPEIITIVIFYLMLFVIFGLINIKGLNKFQVKTITISLIFVIIFNTYLISNYENVELHFIDVGQGDAILIRTKRADYLMDTGGSLFGDYNIAEGITLPYLQKLGIYELDGLFITHFDEDHSQGVPILLEELDIGYIFMSQLLNDYEMLNMISSSGVKSLILKEGHQLKLDNDVFLDIIWPREDTFFNGNNGSLVSILRSNGANILLTGDIEKEAEYRIKDHINYPIDIIKAPHHGSNTSSTDAFIESIGPKDAIISVGRNNMYNHPSADVINRYDEYGINIYRTDEMGLVKVVVDRNGYEIISYCNLD